VQLVPHLNAVYGYLASRLTEDELAALIAITWPAAMAFVWAGSYPASQELAQSALRHAALLCPEHPAVLALRYQVAGMHRLSGQYGQAEQEYRDVLAAYTRVLGPDHPSTRITQDSLTALEALARSSSGDLTD
jgi:hypothetical protein